MRAWLVFPLLLVACQGETVEPPAADGGGTEATVDSAVDTSAVDTSVVDTSVVDTSVVDTSVVDSAVVDTSAVDTATTDGGGSGELLPNNPGFEGCAGWETIDANVTEVAVGRTGRACRVCGKAGVYEYGVKQGLFLAPTPGTKLLGEAWIRADAGDATVAPDPKGSVRLYDAGGTSVQGVDGSPISPDSSWKKASVLVTVAPSTVTQLEVLFGSHQGGTCFVIDDASFRVVP